MRPKEAHRCRKSCTIEAIMGNVVSCPQRLWPSRALSHTNDSHCARSSFAAMAEEAPPADQSSTAPIAVPKEKSAER